MCWIISLLLLAGVLGACSAAKMAYDRAPDLAYWYLDDYVDFTGAQSLQVKDDLVKFQSWHTLQSLRRPVNSPGSGNDKLDHTSKPMRALFERSLDSPNPAYRSYQEKLTQDGCKTFANLHNSTRGAQRGQAIEKLRRYKQGLLARMALNDR